VYIVNSWYKLIVFKVYTFVFDKVVARISLGAKSLTSKKISGTPIKSPPSDFCDTYCGRALSETIIRICKIKISFHEAFVNLSCSLIR